MVAFGWTLLSVRLLHFARKRYHRSVIGASTQRPVNGLRFRRYGEQQDGRSSANGITTELLRDCLDQYCLDQMVESPGEVS